MQKPINIFTKITVVILISFLISFLFSGQVSFNSSLLNQAHTPAIIFAQVPPEEELDPGIEDPDSGEEEPEEEAVENFTINVSANLNGTPLEGVTFNITGPTGNSSLTTSLGGNNSFRNLITGTYTISLILSDDSDFELAQGVSGSQTVAVSATNQTESISFSLRQKEPEVDENIERIREISLPEELTKIGSQTTNFAEIPEDRLESFTGLIFDNPGVNRITYPQALDISNFQDYSRINSIGDQINLEQVGRIQFDTTLFPIFNTNAQLRMSQLQLIDLDYEQIALINNDSSEFTPENLSYDAEAQELTFDVPGFSTYSIVPRFKLDLSELEPVEEESTDETETAEESNDDPEITEEVEELTEELTEGAEDESAATEFTTDAASFNLIVRADNLATTLQVFVNSELVNYPSSPDANGRFSDSIELENGANRIRIRAELPNGESSEQFITINSTTETEPNQASDVFGIVFFLLIIIAGLGLMGYFIYRKRKQNRTDESKTGEEGEDSENDKTVENAGEEEAETEPKYNQNLLTEEEKDLYNKEESTTKSNKSAQKAENTVK